MADVSDSILRPRAYRLGHRVWMIAGAFILAALGARLETDSPVSANPCHRRSVFAETENRSRSFPPLAPRLFAATSPEATQIAAILRQPPQPRLDGRTVVHLLRVYRKSPVPRADVASGVDLLKLLTGYTVVGVPPLESPLVLTRQGARYRSSRSGDNRKDLRENHRDIFLATLAECGMPLSTELQVGESGDTLLSAVLQDSIANFDTQHAEIEWSAIAYAHYLSKQKSWQDRDGNRLTFDGVVEALLQREPRQSACAGAHLLVAMTYMLRADHEAGLLSKDIREALQVRLRNTVQKAVLAQGADGSWANFSHNEPRLSSAPLSRSILVTGHVLEWLQHLPQELQPTSDVYVRAANWLVPQLRQLQRSPTYNSPGWMCPWAHSACALRNLCIEAVVPAIQ